MILTTPQELSALLPANVSTRPERLLTLMEQTERTHIIPLLGKPLYQAVCREYDRLHHGDAVDADGTPLQANDLVTSESHHLGYQYTPMQQLIRLLQVPLVYMTLANNTGILSISLNDGGMNLVSAESYDSAKKDDRQAFSHDCYRNAHEGMEQVLLFLEEDAHSDSPVFLELWSQSDTFYQQYGLLVPTATRFNQIVPIDNSRELYLSLVQRIRYVQDNKVRTEFGDRLTDALVQYTAFGPQPKPVESAPSGQAQQSPQEIHYTSHIIHQTSPIDSFTEDLRAYLPVSRYPGMTADERIKLNGWNQLLVFLQSAVCFYVEMDNKKLRRPDSERDAMLAIERAKDFVRNNSTLFEGVIEDSPLYQCDTECRDTACSVNSPLERGRGVSENTHPCRDTSCSVDSDRTPGGVFDPLGSYYS